MDFKCFKNLIFLFIAGVILGSLADAQILNSGQLDNPYKLIVSSGYLYSVDTANNSVKKFDASGNLLLTYGTLGAGDGQFNQPQGIAADSKGYIYVVDTGNQRIQKLHDDGNKFSFVQTINNVPELNDPNFLFPRSIRVDDNGNIFIVDTAKNRVIKYSTGTVIGSNNSGVSAQDVGESSNGIFNAPYGADIDDGGSIYIADTENNKIKKYSIDGKLLLEFGGQGVGSGQFLYPFDVAVDPNKNIYVADTGNHRIQKFDNFGRHIITFGSMGNNEDQFIAPRGLFATKSGFLYVVGADNKMQKLDVSVHIEDLRATEAVISPNGDGTKEATDIKFNLSEPAVVSVDIYDSTGTVLIRNLIKAQNMNTGENITSWGGTGDNGKVVADGIYIIKVTAKTSDGRKDAIPAITNTLVDNTAPKLAILSPDINLIKGSGAISSIKFYCQASESAEVELEVASEKDGIVFKDKSTTIGISNECKFAWEGKDGNRHLVKTRKEYSLKITAKDNAGNSGEYLNTFVVDNISPEIKNANISKPIFSPTMNYPTKISFEVYDNIFDPLSNLKIEVKKKNNETIRVLQNEQTIQSGTIETSWDGRRWDGKIVPDGKYDIVINIEDGVGNKTEYIAEVETDTLPPSIEATQNLFAFSPNGDGKYDSAEFKVKSNERGKVNLQLTTANSQLINLEVSSEANKENKLTWAKEGFYFCQMDKTGNWQKVGSLSDGKYTWTAYAIDEAGNISGNLFGETIVDTSPPRILSLSADPNPFTPNDDGIKDTTKFNYKLSEPAYVRINILNDGPSTSSGQAQLFRAHEEPTKGFAYPIYDGRRTTDETSLVSRASSLGGWAWDGRGSRNELLGGTYSYYISAEDNVGNISTSEIKSVVVDRAPTLVPYAYASPDPFSAVSNKGGYTEIKYYLARDNIKTSVLVIGREGKTIKTLAKDELQNKGEHATKWYGDFDPGYDGPKAQYNAYKVSDSSYQFKIIAQDIDGGATAEASNTVLVDNVAPNVLIDPVKIDFANKKISVSYKISEKLTIEANIYDEQDNLVEKIASAETMPEGGYTLSINEPKNSSGKFYVKIIALDRALNESERTTEVFAFSPGVFEITGTSAAPAEFTPNSDGHNDTTCVSYVISGGVVPYTASVNIAGIGGATVKRLVNSEEQQKGRQSIVWDGKTDDGKYAADGFYTVQIIIEDAQKVRLEKNIPLLLVSTRPTVDLTVSKSSDETVAFNYSVNYQTQYISGEAAVMLSILNPKNQVVWTKNLSNTPGNYTYSEKIKGISGYNYPRVYATDFLGTNSIPKVVEFDFGGMPSSPPTQSPTQEVPIVVPGTGEAPTISPTQETPQENPSTVISTPEISILDVSPNPAKEGEVSINFKVSCQLKSPPKVYICQNNFEPVLSASEGDYSLASSEYTSKCNIIKGFDGKAIITIEAYSLSGDAGYAQFNDLIIDTDPPRFYGISSEVQGNPEFIKEAKEDSVAIITFKSAEELKFNPEVKVNGNAADYKSSNSASSETEYSYSYKVKKGDENGLAKISITGYDIAGNEGIKESQSTGESFAVDVANPQVTIAKDVSGRLDHPNISTNSDPQGSDKPVKTTFTYTLLEPMKISVKVYKVNDDQIIYAKENFSENNLVAVLASDVWQSGANNISWDGKIFENLLLFDKDSDGYADSGKYAFVVEGRDRAGNLTLKKWGTEVWIQNNILSLREPEQREYESAGIKPKGNPDPPFISPGGNSANASQKQAILYFMIPIRPTPEATPTPEAISAMGVFAPTKKVGKYSVKVYSDAGLANCIRTITEESDAWSGTLLYEIWDGKDSFGKVVDDGHYFMVVDARDYRGKPAENNILSREIFVDSTPPVVSNVSAAPYYFSPGAGTNSVIKSTTLTYEVFDNSSKAKICVDIYKGQGKVIRLVSDEAKKSGIHSLVWAPDNIGTASHSGFDDGIYTFKISAVDDSGNTAEVKTVDVLVDTAVPTFEINTSSRDWARENISVNAKAYGGDSLVKSAQISWSSNEMIPGDSWTNLVNGQEIVQDQDGTWYLHCRAEDNAGNTASTHFGFYKKDNTRPNSPSVAPDHAPVNSWSNHISPYLTWSDPGDGNGSGVKSYQEYIDGRKQDGSASPWHPELSQGEHDLFVRAVDGVNLSNDSQTFHFKIDTAVPSVSFGGQVADTWYSTDNPITFNLSDNLSYRGFRWAWENWPPDDPNGCDIANSLSTTHGGQGEKTLYVRAWDRAGNRRDESRVYRRDSVAPTISDLPNKTFNPYVDGSVRIDFTASDPAPSSGFSKSNITARIKRWNVISKEPLEIYDDGNNNYHVFWDGTNNFSEYNNEGNYTLEIVGIDNVGKGTTKTSTISIQDDQFIGEGREPSLAIEGNLTLRWINGYRYENKSISITAASLTNGENEQRAWLYNNFDEGRATITAAQTGGGDHNKYIYKVSFDKDKSEANLLWKDNPNPYNINLSEGWYMIKTYQHCSLFQDAGSSSVTVSYYYIYYKQYSRSCGQEYQKNITKEATIGPIEVDSYSEGSTSSGQHSVWESLGNIYYKRGNSPNIKIASRPIDDRRSLCYPAITVDQNGNAYISWVNSGWWDSQIYFQKIPSNFAPVSANEQSRNMSYSAIGSATNESQLQEQGQGLEKPALLEPKDSTTVTTLRPTFKWTGIKSVTNYQVNTSPLPLIPDSISTRTFPKNITNSEATPADGSNPTIACSISEFDEGLSKGSWYWKVLANPNSTLESSSDIWSFTVDPPLSITGITNYPNPFNPNRETTKMRYRLGKEADDVKIRICDITGALVRELDGTTNGEGESIWNKYNDVMWDGRNGRGDLVLNGIYPFEVIATLNGQSVSGRGKIAVLK